LFTPDMILRWHREPVAQKWDFSDRREKKPGREWMTQVARNLTDACDGFLDGVRYLLTDRDDKFCAAFRGLLLIPAQSMIALHPGCQSALADSGSTEFRPAHDLQTQVLTGLGRRSGSLTVRHYHLERNHPGLKNGLDTRLIDKFQTAGGNQVSWQP